MPGSGTHRHEERGQRDERLRTALVLLTGLALAVALLLERVQFV